MSGAQKMVTLHMTVDQLSILTQALQNEQYRAVQSNASNRYQLHLNFLSNQVRNMYDAELHLMTCESIKADAKETPIAAGFTAATTSKY